MPCSKMKDEQLLVRPAEKSELHHIVRYFHGLTPSELTAMGTDSTLLPSAEQWQKNLEKEHALPATQQRLFYLLWCIGNGPVGHSNLSHIQWGKTAKMHLHLWAPSQRQKGWGKQFVRQCLPLYFERFELQELICEPLAANPGPNCLLPQLGFDFERKYRTTPGPINPEQMVNRYRLVR